MAPDILVCTPTLGQRQSLHRVISVVNTIAGSRAVHVLVGPLDSLSFYKQTYPWIKLLDDKHLPVGVFPCVNHCINVFGESFKFFAFINDDDLWTTGFKTLIDYISLHSECDLCYGRVSFTTNGQIFKLGAFYPFYRHFSSLLAFDVPLFTQQATIIRLSVFNAIGAFDPRFSLIADSLFFQKASLAGFSMHAIDVYCAEYDLSPGRLTSSTQSVFAEISLAKRLGLINSSPSFIDYARICLYRLFNVPTYLRNYFRAVRR